LRSLLAIPLYRESQLLGGLSVFRRSLGSFSDDVVNLLQTFANQSVLAIHNARLFQEIQEKGRQLEIASEHKSQFLANMSHELRTPLNAILGYTELIVDNIYGEVPEQIASVLERVDRNGRHLLTLINDVLDISKMEAGQLSLSFNDYSMQEIVGNVIAAVESLGDEKNLPLKADLSPELPLGKGDEQRITQVLLNLVSNAIKFTDEGEVSIKVVVSDDTFQVSVTDTGMGISEADQKLIFEEFQQADGSATRAKGGTGLGLAIARRIVEMHGGRLRVESTLGEGATFTFTLPVRAEQRTEAA
jgi:signal transduction histidine kinase